MKNPLVSVIIPVYNVEKYLPACLDSVCNQTLRELEIIVVDDGSTDRSGCIADEFARKDCRIRVVHKRNGNPGATRNVGLELVNGEYIGFVDSDDWIDPDMYERLYRAAEATQADLVVTGVCVEFTRDKRKLFQQIDKEETVEDSTKLLDLFFQLKDKNLIAYPYNKLFKTSMIQRELICFPEILPFEDFVFNLKYYMSIRTVSLISGTYYHYMRRDELSAAGAYSPKHLEACKLTEDVFRSFLEHFCYPSDRIESLLRQRRLSDYSAYASGFYKRNCTLTRKERLFRLKKDLFDNRQLRQDITLSAPSGFYSKMFYFFIQHTTPVITDSYYLFLFFLRNHCDLPYRTFRKLIS
nr:glycosyltransferase [Parabacteroides goldsteinii]